MGPVSHPHHASHWIQEVVLAARDPERLAAFYGAALGLTPERSADAFVLRVAPDAAHLLRIEHATRRAPQSRVPGLFHTAFLMPDRGALASWLSYALGGELPLVGASDHGVSEAIYLNDPEGNGIEVYADRPVATWHDRDGRLHMPSDRLDLHSVLAAETGSYDQAPRGLTLGHVHLSVPDLAAGEVWASRVGLDLTTRYPGASFLSWDGYHHHVAMNAWGMRGAEPRRIAGAPGLSEIVIGRTGAHKPRRNVDTLFGIEVSYRPAASADHAPSPSNASAR
ncbi:MAG: VOC family protein [Pseudomonadota bacterium]